MNLTFRGQQVEADIRDGQYIFTIVMQKPFYFKGEQWFSLSDKLVEASLQRNATIKAIVDGIEFTVKPTKKGLREKKKRGEYETVKTKFAGMEDWHRWLYPFKGKQKN